jgi:hypothetical protein
MDIQLSTSNDVSYNIDSHYDILICVIFLLHRDKKNKQKMVVTIKILLSIVAVVR